MVMMVVVVMPARLGLLPQIIPNFCEIFFQSQRHGLGRAGENTRADASGNGYTKNTAQRAATIDCIH